MHGLAIAASDDERAAGLAALLGALVPRARIARLAAGPVSRPPDAGAVVLDAASGGMDMARRLRAAGYEGALVLATQSSMSDDAQAEAARLGVAECREGEELGACLAQALSTIPDGSSMGEALRQSRRLLAAGTVALRLQHAINNPLAALLAEAQLLEMDELNEEQKAAVRRMVELCRRVNALVRELDGITPSRAG